MMIDREAIEKRLAELRQSLDRIQANGNAIGGAIQDCEFWLSQLEQEEKPKLELVSSE